MIVMYERENIAAYPKGVVVDMYVPGLFVWGSVPMFDLSYCILLIVCQK